MRPTRFLAALAVAAAALTACTDGPGPAQAPAAAGSATGTPPEATGAATETTGAASGATGKPSEAAGTPRTTKTAGKSRSDVSQLERAGLTIGESVLIDVADDDGEHYLQVGKSSVDFTGTTRTDSTMMSLKPAQTADKNRVVIQPPFWNEDLGAGHCVADTAGAALKLEVCKPGKASQIWRVALAGDSGQFELHGAYGVVKIDDGRITTGESGRTGLQTVRYAS